MLVADRIGDVPQPGVRGLRVDSCGQRDRRRRVTKCVQADERDLAALAVRGQ